MLSVNYDQSVLKLIKVTDGGLLGTSDRDPDLEKAPYILSWANDTKTENFTSNGTIATLTFEISNSATGNSPISIVIERPADILNYQMNKVSFFVKNGAVTVSDITLHIQSIQKDGKQITTTLVCNDSEAKETLNNSPRTSCRQILRPPALRKVRNTQSIPALFTPWRTQNLLANLHTLNYSAFP